MDDTIYRQSAIDVIRKCSVKEVTSAYMLIDQTEAMTELLLLPSSQPVIISTPSYSISIGEPVEYIPIMRCKDCKYYLPPHGCLQTDGMATAQENGFCSYAERQKE